MARKQKIKLVIIIGIGLLAIALFAFAYRRRNTLKNTTNPVPFYPKASTNQPASTQPSATPEVVPSAVGPEQTQTNTSGRPTITSPAPSSTLTDGSKITGRVIAGTSGWYYRIKGGKSGQLALGPVFIDKSGNFNFTVSLTNQVIGGNDQGELEIYQQVDAGPDTNVTSILITVAG